MADILETHTGVVQPIEDEPELAIRCRGIAIGMPGEAGV